MINCEIKDIVLVPFPFSDLKDSKKRPVLVLSKIRCKTLPSLLIVSMITSNLNSEEIAGDILLKDWKLSGLLYSSKVRLAKLVSIESNIILKKIGTISTNDFSNIKKEFISLFKWL